MGSLLTTEGELHKTVTHITSQECVEGIGAGAGASNNGKQTNKGIIG